MPRTLTLFALIAVCLCPAAAQKAAVEVRDGVPTLIIDGEPAAPVIYRENYNYHYREQSQAHYQSLYRAGVRIFFFPIGIGHSNTHEQRVESWSKWSDPVIEDLIAATGPDTAAYPHTSAAEAHASGQCRYLPVDLLDTRVSISTLIPAMSDGVPKKKKTNAPRGSAASAAYSASGSSSRMSAQGMKGARAPARASYASDADGVPAPAEATAAAPETPMAAMTALLVPYPGSSARPSVNAVFMRFISREAHGLWS